MSTQTVEGTISILPLNHACNRHPEWRYPHPERCICGATRLRYNYIIDKFAVDGSWLSKPRRIGRDFSYSYYWAGRNVAAGPFWWRLLDRFTKEGWSHWFTSLKARRALARYTKAISSAEDEVCAIISRNAPNGKLGVVKFRKDACK